MKILPLLLLLMIPIAYGLEECKGTLVTTEIPCLVLLPYTTDCHSLHVSFYNESGLIYHQSMDNYTGFLCNATFNLTERTTYTFNYTTGDTGSIVVEDDDDMMLAIVVGIGIFAAFLLLLSWKLEDEHYLLKLLLMFMGVTSLTIIPLTFITGDSSIVFNKLVFYFIRIFWVYVAIYFIWWLFNKLRRTVPNEGNR